MRGLLALTVVMAGCCGRQPAPPVVSPTYEDDAATRSCVRPPATEPTANVVWGVISDARGAAIAGAEIEAVTWEGGPLDPGRVAVRATSDAAGGYVLRLPPGTYTIRIGHVRHVIVWVGRRFGVHTVERFDARIDGEQAPGVIAVFDGTQRQRWVDRSRPTCDWTCAAAGEPPPNWWMETSCPDGATLRMRAGDREQSVSCELPDGTPHGPFTRWRPARRDGTGAWHEAGWYDRGKRCAAHDASPT